MSDRTRVGHCKADETDVYAGRGTGGRNLNNTAIGTRGWLGNPHTLEDYTREESIDLFREDFEAKLRGDEKFREAVADLSGRTLGCWCQRLDEDGPACHAEVIRDGTGAKTPPSSVDLPANSPFVIPTEAPQAPDVMRQYREVHSVARRYPRRPVRCGYRQKTTQVLPNPARIGITGAWHSLYYDGIRTRGSQHNEDRLRGKPRPLGRGGCHRRVGRQNRGAGQ